jgi:hypothetical protein
LPSPPRSTPSALRLGVNELELPELDKPLELDDPDDEDDEPDDDELDDDELDDDELEEELEELEDADEDDEDAELDEELDPPVPVVGAPGESAHAVVNPAAARKVPCDRSRRKSRRA